MLSRLENIKIPFVKSNEIKFLLLFGLVYRLAIFAVYTTVTKWPDSWGFMVLSEYLLRFDLSGYNGEEKSGLCSFNFFGVWDNENYHYISIYNWNYYFSLLV